MKRHYRGYRIWIVLMSLVLAVITAGGLTKTVLAAKNKATTIRLVRTEGKVTVKNSKMEELIQTADMRLSSGDHQITGAESYAWMSLDDTKAVKLDENSEAELRKKWRKLEVLLDSGSIFFNVTVPLESDEELNIRSATIVTGIRGTCGWVRVMDGGSTRVYLLEGSLECVVTNPVEGGTKTITLKPGEYADFIVRDPEQPGETTDIVSGRFTEEDIEPYVLVELVDDEPLVEKIYEQSGIDLRKKTKDGAKKKLDEQQIIQAEKQTGIRGKAIEQDGIVLKDPVWDDGNPDDAIIYLTMPQTATTVQKYLDMSKVKKVVLLPGEVSQEENTLKVDIVFQTPVGKILESRAGVQVRVLENYSFATNGTSLLKDVLTNNGTVTVNSANTLRVWKRVINHGLFDNTADGRVVFTEGIESDGTFQTAGLVETEEDVEGDTLIKITGGNFVITDGTIITDRFKTILDVQSESQVTLSFEGGAISNDQEGGTTISVSTGDFKVDSMETDIMGITDTVFGEAVNPEDYGAATVYRTDGRYHVVALSKVESYNVLIGKVEFGTISAPSRVEVGATVPLTLSPNAGYKVGNISVAMKSDGANVSVSDNASFVMPRGDVVVSGSFVKISEDGDDQTGQLPEDTYQITASAVHGTIDTNVNAALSGEQVKVTVTPDVGYEFDSLTINASGRTIPYTGDNGSYSFMMPAENVSVTANFKAQQFTITFYDADGSTVLSRQTCDYGAAPSYSGNTPKKGSTKQYSYIFSGWKNSAGQTYGNGMPLPAVTGDDSYTAQFKENQLTYTVTWKNEDGTVLRTDTKVYAGTIPSYGRNPSRANDAKYTYTFKGWTDDKTNYNVGIALPEVTADVTYRALYTSTINRYSVTFVDEDGTTVLKSAESYDYGTSGSAITKPVEPSKASTAQYDYPFAGWSNGVSVYATASIPDVTGNVTYKATYTQQARSYTVEFVNYDGTVLSSKNYAYGTAAGSVQLPADPTRPGDGTFTYNFIGWTPAVSDITGNATYTATYSTTGAHVTGVVLDKTSDTVILGKTGDLTATVLPADSTNKNVTWKSSNDSVASVSAVAGATGKATVTPNKAGTAVITVTTEDGGYEATCTVTVAGYNIYFRNSDATLLKTYEDMAYNAIPAYDAGTPTKDATAQYTYTFDGWENGSGEKFLISAGNATLPKVTEETTYFAVYANSVNKYTVTWKNADGSVLETDADVPYGDVPSYDGAVPTKTGDAQYSYNFAGWDKTITTVSGNVTYNATFTQSINKYTVTWTNWDNTVLETDDAVTYGDMPSYDSTAPTRVDDAQYSYTFSGWTPTVSAVQGNVTYKATFNSKLNKYTVTFQDENGNELTSTQYDYGTAAASIMRPADPTKTADVQYTYTFAGWTPAIEEVQGNAVYKATYTSKLNKYDITFVDEDGTSVLLATKTYDYGTLAADITKPADPTKTATTQYTYVFSGWDPAVTAVTGNVTYKATYTANTNQYMIYFQNEDGSPISSGLYNYGTSASTITPNAPTKDSDLMYTYTFAGWDPAVTMVMGSATYKATFTATPVEYAVNLYTQNANATINSGNVTSYTYGVGATLPTDVTLANHRFGGWYTSATPAAGDTAVTAIGTDAIGVRNFYAKWIPLYNLTVAMTQLGSVSVDINPAAEGEKITVTVTPNAGYELNRLSYTKVGAAATTVITKDANDEYTFTMPDADVSVNASFKAKTISGTLSLTGTPKVNENLTATITGGSNVGTLSYKWQKDGVDIAGEASDTYHIKGADFGATITCIVTSDIESGQLRASASGILAADTVTLTVGTDTIDAAKLNTLFSDDSNSIVRLVPGNANGSNEVTITGNVTIPEGKTLEIAPGVTLEVGNGNVSGTVVNLSKYSIHNSGIIVVSENGTLTNGSTTLPGNLINEENAFILIKGTFENLGDSTVTNEGKIFYLKQSGEDGLEVEADIDADETIKAMMSVMKDGCAVSSGTKGNVVCIITKDTDNSTDVDTCYQAEFMGEGAVYDSEDDAWLNDDDYMSSWQNFIPNGRNQLTKAVVDEGVIALARKQFANCTGLISVELPNSITEIPYGAFGAFGLSGGGSNQIFAERVMYSLTSITFGNNLQTIGKEAFRNCTALTSIAIPDTVTTIGESAFDGCSSLVTVSIPSSVTTIEERAFADTAIVELILPEGLKELGDEAFYNASELLQKVTIPVSLEKIGINVFEASGFSGNFGNITFYFNGTDDQWFELKYKNGWNTLDTWEYSPSSKNEAGRTQELIPVFNYGDQTTEFTFSFRYLVDKGDQGMEDITADMNAWFTDALDGSYNGQGHIWKTHTAHFCDFVYFYDLFYDLNNHFVVNDYLDYTMKVYRVDESGEKVSELYYVGFDRGGYRGAFMMPYSDVILEVVFKAPLENQVIVKNAADLLDALQRNVPEVYLNGYTNITTDNCTEFHVPSGTTLYLNSYLCIWEYVTMVVDEGASVYNGSYIWPDSSNTDPERGEVFPKGVLINNGTIYDD